MTRISSRQNPAVKRFRELARTPDPHAVLLDGEHLLEEAIRSRVDISIVACSDRLPEERVAALTGRARDAGARMLLVTDDVMKAMSPVKEPSGVVAIAARRAVTIDEALGTPPQLALVLAGIQDPGNVGAIIRVAEACGVTGIVATRHTSDPFGWKALRGAMGSTFRVPVATGMALGDAVVEARRHGTRVLAAVPRDGTPLPRADLRGPVAALLGGEGGGLPQDAIDLADEHLTIPMRPPVDSLNVATAAALIVYEASRQRDASRT
jgi:TrmH family RNA methyltransferase